MRAGKPSKSEIYVDRKLDLDGLAIRICRGVTPLPDRKQSRQSEVLARGG